MSTTKDQTVKSQQKWEIEKSDRIDLVRAANSLVDTMVIKQKPGGLFTGDQQVGQDLNELSEQESEAYHAALGFLAQQFKSGPRTTQSHLVDNNEERSEKLQSDKDTQESEKETAKS